MGCTGNGADEVDLATRCLRASDDNRVKHSASMLSDADIEVGEDRVVVRARVPVGISLSAKIKFRHWTYTCRRDGEQLFFVGYETRGP